MRHEETLKMRSRYGGPTSRDDFWSEVNRTSSSARPSQKSRTTRLSTIEVDGWWAPVAEKSRKHAAPRARATAAGATPVRVMSSPFRSGSAAGASTGRGPRHRAPQAPIHDVNPDHVRAKRLRQHVPLDRRWCALLPREEAHRSRWCGRFRAGVNPFSLTSPRLTTGRRCGRVQGHPPRGSGRS